MENMLSVNWCNRKIHAKELDTYFFTYDKSGIICNYRIMMVELRGINTWENWKAKISFMTLKEFLLLAIEFRGYGKEGIIWFDFEKVGYVKEFIYKALKLCKDAEIGLPDRIAPLVIRNEFLNVYIAPRVEEVD